MRGIYFTSIEELIWNSVAIHFSPGHMLDEGALNLKSAWILNEQRGARGGGGGDGEPAKKITK